MKSKIDFYFDNYSVVHAKIVRKIITKLNQYHYLYFIDKSLMRE